MLNSESLKEVIAVSTYAEDMRYKLVMIEIEIL